MVTLSGCLLTLVDNSHSQLRSNLAVVKFPCDFILDPTNTHDLKKYGHATYLLLKVGNISDFDHPEEPSESHGQEDQPLPKEFQVQGGDNVPTIPSLLQGPLLVMAEKDMDNNKWEKNKGSHCQVLFPDPLQKAHSPQRLPMYTFLSS